MVVLKGKRIAGLALVLLVAGMAVLIGVVKMNTQKYAVEGAFCENNLFPKLALTSKSRVVII